MNKTIVKIWIVIVVLACTYAALVYWGARSYRDSAASIERILSPDEESRTINALYKFMVQSDLHFNNFILTNDSTQWRNAVSYGEKADSLIIVFENHIGMDRWQDQPSFDTLKTIMEEKNRINSILIDLKNRKNSHFFTEDALNRIKLQLSDSAYVDKAITQKGDLIAKRDTLERMDIVKSPDDYEGMSGFFRKIFGKERIQIDTIVTLEEQINYGLEVSIDSSVVRDYYVDTTLAVVKNILIDVLEEEVLLQRRLYATELELVNYNELLLKNVRELLEDISRANQLALQSEREVAKRKIENAHLQAFGVAGAGILLGFFLLLVLIKDVTQTNLYRTQLEQEKERAEQLAAAKETFLSKMSHEIRTPLHSISGFAQLLDQKISGKEARSFLTGINHANHYLNELISNILEQAKINAGTFNLESTEVFVPDLCRELDLLFKPRQEEQGNRFKLNYSENLKQHLVQIDSVKLKQVLINLLGNAFKYTKRGDVLLNFVLEEDRSRLKIEVADTGEGIDPKDQESIFQPFNQLPNGKMHEVSGTGLGLSISKHIVEHFGGDMHLESELGKGSRFTLFIPVSSKEYVVQDKEKVAEQAHERYYPIRVLAVEDDSWNAYLLENYLSGYIEQLDVFESAELGLEAIQTQVYDLVLTDLNLPGMDGRAFFQSLPEDSKVPVVALSASLSKQEFDRLIEMGFANALGKPFDQRDLLEALAGLFSSNSREQRSIDTSAIVRFFDGSPVQAQAHLERFKDSFEEKLVAFAEAIQSKNLGELSRMAHQLKSNCEQVGISGLSEQLQSIELFAEMANQGRALEEAGKILPELKEVLEQLKQ